MLDRSGVDLDLLLSGGVFCRETFPRMNAALSDQATVLTTQVMTSAAVILLPGDIVTSVAFRSGATAAGVPTNWWFALYDTAGALMGQTADQLTAAWAANATKTLPLVSAAAPFPFTVKAPGVYYVACMVKATTVPSLVCQTLFDASLSSGLVAGQKTLAQTSGSALTGTAPATIATPTAIALRPYAVLS